MRKRYAECAEGMKMSMTFDKTYGGTAVLFLKSFIMKRTMTPFKLIIPFFKTLYSIEFRKEG